MAQNIAKPAADATEACVGHLAGFCFSNKIDLGLIVTISIFVIGLFWAGYVDKKRDAGERLKAENKQKLIRRQYLLALREEIGLNIAGLERSVTIFPSRTDLTVFLNSAPDARPLITFNYYSVIFRNRTEVLQDLPDTLIKNVVDFYGKLDEIALDCAAVNSPAFVSISKGGRLDTMLDIRAQARVAQQQGIVLRDAITLHLIDKFGAPGV